MTKKEIKQSIKRVKDLPFDEALTILAYQIKAHCVNIGRLQNKDFVFRMLSLTGSRLEYYSLDNIKEKLMR